MRQARPPAGTLRLHQRYFSRYSPPARLLHRCYVEPVGQVGVAGQGVAGLAVYQNSYSLSRPTSVLRARTGTGIEGRLQSTVVKSGHFGPLALHPDPLRHRPTVGREMGIRFDLFKTAHRLSMWAARPDDPSAGVGAARIQAYRGNFRIEPIASGRRDSQGIGSRIGRGASRSAGCRQFCISRTAVRSEGNQRGSVRQPGVDRPTTPDPGLPHDRSARITGIAWLAMGQFSRKPDRPRVAAVPGR